MKTQLTTPLGYILGTAPLRLKAELLRPPCCSKHTSPEVATQEYRCLTGTERCRVPWLQPEEANTKQTCRQHFPAVTTQLRRARSPSFDTHRCPTDTARQPSHPSAFRLDEKGREERCEVALICKLEEMTQQPIAINSN